MHAPLRPTFQQLRHLVIVTIIGLTTVAMAATLLPTAAFAQTTPQHELLIGVDFDGTAAFTADAADDGQGGHTPGLDDNANNNVLRTNDQIQYSMDWNVNEADATGVTIRASLPPTMEWLPDATTVFGAPGGCTDDGTSTINTPNPGDLVCIIAGDQIEGSNGTIHPRALLNGELDGVVLSLTGTIESNEEPNPAVSNIVETTVSAVPRGNWIKGAPIVDSVSGAIVAYEPDEEYFSVPDENGVPGRLFVWSLRLEPNGGLKGAEPINDAVPIQFFDHFFDTVPSARLATAAMMPANDLGQARVPCGGYDGDDAYPYGQTVGGANATPAAQTNIGLWECTVVGGTYPIVQIDVTGHDTQNIATTNASLSPNTSTLASGQIAMWAAESELIAKPDIPRIIVNAISGTTGAIAPGTTLVDPIQVAGTNGPVDESTSDGDGASAGLSNASPYEFPTSPPSSPGRAFRHFIRYTPGPYQETQYQDFTGKTYQWYDHNTTNSGGVGRHVTNGVNVNSGGAARQWDGDGQTPRGNVLSVLYGISTTTSSPNPPVVHDEPIHACVQLDTTHQELVGMPPTYPITTRATATGNGQDSWALIGGVIGGATGTPSSPIANVLASSQGFTVGAGSWAISTGGVVTDRPQLDYVIEVGVGTNPGNAQTVNNVSCNTADVATWVDASSAANLAQFQTGTMTDGTPIYGGITHMRVRTSGPTPWAGNVRNNNSYGSAMMLGFQVRVKDDVVAQAKEQELIVYGARGSGEWDGSDQPPTPQCTNFNRWNLELNGSNANPPSGWCNLPFTDDGATSTTLGDQFNEYDARAVEVVDVNGAARSAHADKVFIVEAALALSKSNTGGASEIVANGNIVEFAINPQVVGSSLDEIDAVTVTDTLPATMVFQGFTMDPSVGTCTHSGGTPVVDPIDPTQTVTAGGTITCTYGDDYAGGWGLQDEGKFAFEVMIVGASADSTLTNTAQITGNDGPSGVAKRPATSRASVFTGAPFDESVIVKAIDTGAGDCDQYPAGPVDAASLDPEPADWADRCERIVYETTPGGGTSTMGFNLEMANQGNTPLTDVRFVDVLPHNADQLETFSNTGADGVPVPTMGDGRTPETDTAGDLSFVGLTGDVGTVWVSTDDPLTISRDPDRAIVDTVWCDGIGGANYPGGLAGPCPTTATEVTGVFAEMDDIAVGEKITATLTLETVNHECDDIWTNTFGARVDQIGLPIRSNDVSIMVDCVYDLALTKVPAPGWAPGADWLTAGTSTVDFVIELENQGDPVNNFEITDYVDPTMFAFDISDNPDGLAGALPYSWDDSGPNPVVSVNDPALAGSDPSSTVFELGDTIQIPITLIVSPTYVAAGELSNTAEISYFDNDADAANGDSASGDIVDVDSVPDATDDDVLIDDETGLDAASGDEDDHDIAIIPIYDLAIDKANPTMTQTATGWVATFDVTVTNESNVAVADIGVLETPPAGLAYASSDAGAITSTSGGAAVVVTDADPNYTVDTLAAGDSVTFTISYDVTDLTAGPYTNSVQIDSFTDAAGNPAVDIDSAPGNDTDHGDSNEDDDDVETVSLPFDLALVKKPFLTDPAYPDLLDGLQNGDEILFHVEVFNQLATIEDFDIIDYLTPGWVFDLAAQPAAVTLPGSMGGPALPFVWNTTGADPVAEVDGVLAGGQSVIIPVVLTAEVPNDPPMVLENVAEILRFDDDGDPTNGDSSGPDGLVDIDSNPDGLNDDLLVDDEFEDDGTTDEDDHDVAFTNWYDVALNKQIFDGTACVDGPLALTTTTATVSYCLMVLNQGPTSLYNVAFTDTPPAGLVFASTDVLPAGVTEVVGGSYVVGTLPAGSFVTVQLTYDVDLAAMTSASLDNVAEVTEMFSDPAGTVPAADIDSFVDPTPDGDAPTEDDEDVQTVTMPYDLALQKTLGPIVGDQVTMFITVTNQSIAVEQIEITDYVDPTMWETFSLALNPGGAASGPAAAFSYSWDTTDPDNPVATVAPDVAGDKLGFGETVTIPIVLNISDDFSGTVIDNHAEISNFDSDDDPTNGDGADGTLIEADSTPDGEDGNGPGEAGNSVDDDIDGDPALGGDEDDYDGVLVPIFDLALTKTLDPSVVQPIALGDEVTFLITIANQGTTHATNPTAIDYIDLGFFEAFDATLGANASGTTTGDAALAYAWAADTAVPTNGALTVTGTLAPGETITIPITLQVSLTPTASTITNTAEITGGTATDAGGTELTDGNGDPLTDRDSTPDAVDDDTVVDDVTNNDGGDEDDHDIAEIFLAIPMIDIEKATNGQDSDGPVGEQLIAGEDVTWTYVVENTGTTALLNAVVADSDPAVTVVCAPAVDNVIPLLIPGQQVTCEATGIATAGSYMNTATVDGTPALPTDPDADLSDPASWPTDPADFTETGQDNPEDADDSHYFGTDGGLVLEKATNLEDADDAPGVQLAVGEAVTWTYVVTNTSPVAMIAVEVTDSDIGSAIDCGDGTNVIALLPPGETVTCTSIDPVEAISGSYRNDSGVTGTGSIPADPEIAALPPEEWPTDPAAYIPTDEPTYSDDDPSNYFGFEGGLSLEKSTNDVDSDVAPGEAIEAGSAVTWTYAVTNDSNAVMINVSVADSDPTIAVDCGDGSNLIAVLPIGETITCEATGTAISGAYTNDSKVAGTPAILDPNNPDADPTDPASYLQAADDVTDEDPSNYWGMAPAIDIEKSTNDEDADASPGAAIGIGGDVVWTYDVTNTGDATLINVAVADSDPAIAVDCGDGSNLIAVLPIGETVTCEATGTAISGAYTNDSSATGTPAILDPNDPDADPTDPASYVTAPVEVTDDDPSNYFGFEGGLSLEKSTNGFDSDVVPGQAVAAGDAVTWTYAVTNDSNAAMINVTVADSDPALVVDCGDGTNVIGVLAIGETVTCEATGTAIGGQYTNDSTVTGTPALLDPNNPDADPTDPASYLQAADDVSDEDPSHYFGSGPAIDIEKSTNGDDADEGPGAIILVGDPVVWTYVVTNIGDVALVDVTVSDDQGVAVDCGDGTATIAVLGVGESVTCEGNGEAIDSPYENIGAVTGTPGYEDPENPGSFLPLPGAEPVADNDESHYNGSPGQFDLALKKVLLSTSGAAQTFGIDVINQGSVTAVDITVVDYLPAGMILVDPDWTDHGDGTASILVPGPVAPGESISIEIDTRVTASGSYENLAGIEGATPLHPATGDPLDLDDVDSKFGDSTEDPLTDDVTDNSDGDEDDSDIAVVTFTTNPIGGTTPNVAAPGSPTEPVPAVVAATPIPELALTGREFATLASTGLLLVVGGAALVLATRRRRDPEDLDWLTTDELQ